MCMLPKVGQGTGQDAWQEGATATSKDRQIASLQAKITEMSADAVRYKKTIQELTAKKNGINRKWESRS